MSVRVQNGEILSFGTFAAAVTVTHVRVTRGTQMLLNGHALSANVAVEANGSCQFSAGTLDLVFPEGDMEDAGLKQMIDVEFAKSMKVDLMTSATQLVTDTGYSAANSSDWDSSIE